MAKSPVLLKSYVYLSEQVGNTDLTPLERQLVLMRVSRFQECRYCLADHTPHVETHGVDMGGDQRHWRRSADREPQISNAGQRYAKAC